MYGFLSPLHKGGSTFPKLMEIGGGGGVSENLCWKGGGGGGGIGKSWLEREGVRQNGGCFVKK